MKMRVKSNILYAELNEFTNKDTGEVTEMTKIVYTIERESSDSAVGPAILEAYKPGNFLKELEPFTAVVNANGRPARLLVELELTEQYLKNGKKYVVKKINDFDFSKKN